MHHDGRRVRGARERAVRRGLGGMRCRGEAPPPVAPAPLCSPLPTLSLHPLSQTVILFLTFPQGGPPGPRCHWGRIRFLDTTPCAFPEPTPVLVSFTSGAMTASPTLYLFKAARRPLYRKENLQLLAAERGSVVDVWYNRAWVAPELWGEGAIRPGTPVVFVFADRPYTRFVPVRQGEVLEAGTDELG